MRLTVVHLLVLAVLALPLASASSAWASGHVGLATGFAAGTSVGAIVAGPFFRWLCVWPLVPKCPRCGLWVRGLHRAAGPEGLLLIASPCEHAFVLKGAWVVAPLRLPAALRASVAEELGWAIRPDGRVFRFRDDYAATLLDEDGQEIGRRRARWPYWPVRWTSA